MTGVVSAGCFLLHANKSVSFISIPGATKCSARHINNAGSIVGWYLSSTFAELGFLTSANGKFTQINIPNCFSTTTESINNKTEIVGTCSHGGPVLTEGFLLRASGAITMINPPMATSTFPTDINDKGQIVGHYYTAKYEHYSFLCSDGQFSTITIPECSTVEARSINNQGQIVGLCGISVPPFNQGFIFDTTNSSSRFLIGPKGASTSPNAMNNRGDIVGTW